MEERRNMKSEPFFIEAAVDERGPKTLKVVESYNQYHVYDDAEMITCIQVDEDGDWEQIDGDVSNGIVILVGQAIKRHLRK